MKRPYCEVAVRFYFEAAHTLTRSTAGDAAEGSARVHGHSYECEAEVHGLIDEATGMVVDAAVLNVAVEAVREALDHRMLNDVRGLGAPTSENLCVWIWKRLAQHGLRMSRVTVSRPSIGMRVSFYGVTGG